MRDKSLKAYFSRLWKDELRHKIPWVRDGVILGAVMLLTTIPVAATLYGLEYVRKLDWKLIKATLFVDVAILLGYGAYHFIRAVWRADVARQQEIEILENVVAEKNEKIRHLTTPPDLEIRWMPGESKYFYPYMLPPGNFNLYYRFCIVNNSDTYFSSVSVKLDKLSPNTLTCVPCNLQLMSKERNVTVFSLPPNGGNQFVDLMLQNLEATVFWILHNAIVDVRVPAEAYSMTIKAEADGQYFSSRDFYLEKNGPLWNLMAEPQTGGSKTTQR